jgi:hypothetical protein
MRGTPQRCNLTELAAFPAVVRFLYNVVLPSAKLLARIL